MGGPPGWCHWNGGGPGRRRAVINKCLSNDISAKNAENHMCRKGTWSATESNTTNWMMALVSPVHSVIRNLPCLMIYILI